MESQIPKLNRSTRNGVFKGGEKKPFETKVGGRKSDMGRRERMKRTTWQKRKEEKWKTHTEQEEEGRRSLEEKSGDADYAGNQEQEPPGKPNSYYWHPWGLSLPTAPMADIHLLCFFNPESLFLLNSSYSPVPKKGAKALRFGPCVGLHTTKPNSSNGAI